MECLKRGYEYITTNSLCWYKPGNDSIPIGSSITLEAAVPRIFIDEKTNTLITNTSSSLEGPLAIGMIYPSFEPAIDSFELNVQTGKIIKDSIHLSEGQLKGVRAVRWDSSVSDSFKIRITIKAIARGVYAFALKQQTSVDKDCALYKYFLSPGNTNQHLDYWAKYVQNPSEDVVRFTYCFKVY